MNCFKIQNSKYIGKILKAAKLMSFKKIWRILIRKTAFLCSRMYLADCPHCLKRKEILHSLDGYMIQGIRD